MPTAPPRPLPLVIDPALRFSCHGCGVCCREFVVGVDAAEVERIARHDWAREAPRFRAPFALPAADAFGRPGLALRRVEGGACVFLDADGLCLVEKRLGREAKPRHCRKFPFELIAASDGTRVAVSIECASRWRSIEDGAPVEGARAELEVIAATSEPHRIAWRVRLSAGGPLLAPEAYLAIEANLRAAVARPGDPLEETLRALGRAVPRARPPSPPGAPDADRAVADLAAALAPAAADRPASLRSGLAALAAAGATRHWLPDAEAASVFLRATLAGWIDEAWPGRAPTAADGVGRMIFGALLAAAIAGGRDASPEDLNRGAREVSLFFRGRAARAVREAAGGRFEVVSGAFGF